MTGLVIEKRKFYEYRFVIGWIGAVDIIIHILTLKNFHITFVQDPVDSTPPFYTVLQ